MKSKISIYAMLMSVVMMMTACSKEEEETSASTGYQGRRIKEIVQYRTYLLPQTTGSDTTVYSFEWQENQLNLIKGRASLYYIDGKVSRFGIYEIIWNGDEVSKVISEKNEKDNWGYYHIITDTLNYTYANGKPVQVDDRMYTWTGNNIIQEDEGQYSYKYTYDTKKNPFKGLPEVLFESPISNDLFTFSLCENNITSFQLVDQTGAVLFECELAYEYDAQGYPVELTFSYLQIDYTYRITYYE